MIELHNVTKVYGTDVTALDRLSFTVEKGEFVFLTGPSGAGKSTLLRLLLRQEVPTEGTLTVGGRELATLSTREVQAYRRSLGVVFQDFKLSPTKTVFDNVAFVMRVLGVPVEQQRRRTYQVLKGVGLQHRALAYPPELSGGEQQRVAIARALITDPVLVLADEPTGNLDTRTADEIADLLHQVAKGWGRSVFMVTHDPRIAAYADRIVFLKDGKIVNETRLEAKRDNNQGMVDNNLKTFAQQGV